MTKCILSYTSIDESTRDAAETGDAEAETGAFKDESGETVLFQNTTIETTADDSQLAIRLEKMQMGSGDEPASRPRHQKPSAAQLESAPFTPLASSGFVNNIFKSVQRVLKSPTKLEKSLC